MDEKLFIELKRKSLLEIMEDESFKQMLDVVTKNAVAQYKEGDTFSFWQMISGLTSFARGLKAVEAPLLDVLLPEWVLAEIERISTELISLTSPEKNQQFSANKFNRELARILRLDGNKKRRAVTKRRDMHVRVKIKKLIHQGITKRESLVEEISQSEGMSRRTAESLVDMVRRRNK